ncbi:glycosyltransferase [Leifsonia aquatica]|uniref:glycosyltransferase family protein n=1 Tax=Leifsonia aquatica TaxID=144185 RepID=UPI00384CFCAA
MRVLLVANPSNPDNSSSDSGVVFARTVGSALQDAGHDVSYAGYQVELGRAGTTFELPTPKNKYEARHWVPWREIRDAIASTTPDIVVANQIEHAPAIRTALTGTVGATRLVGYAHYLPFALNDGRSRAVSPDPSLAGGGLGTANVYAFIAGLSACDEVFVHSRAAEGWVRRMLAWAGDAELAHRLRVLPPPIDRQVVDVARLHRSAAPTASASVLYNHRLYEHYGTGSFVEVVRSAPDVHFTVCDPIGRRSADRHSLDSSPGQYARLLAAEPNVLYRPDDGVRANYLETVRYARAAVAADRSFCPWSMSSVECMYLGVPVVGDRRHEWYREMFPEQLLYDGPTEAAALIRDLVHDDGLWGAMSAAVRQRASAHSDSAFVDHLVEHVESVR